MAIVQYYVASTIDGFIADSEDNIDWLLQFGFENFQEDYDRFMADVGAIVMGSTTYEYIIGEGADSWAYGATPVWVLTSRSLPPVPGADIRFFNGEVADVHRDALEAAQGKNVWVVGGGNVAAQFADRGLLDELLLTIMPIVLGSGKQLLPIRAVTEPLTLVDTTPFPRGAIGLRYRLTALPAQ
ncbi:MAG TPA: dihydrofolate reductase family protein [Homoserinimonas sp.]|nr:dihydrofolate reductase family protein [Homoserinimonas sp.]